MSSRSKFSIEEKIKAVEEYRNGGKCCEQICTDLGIGSSSTIRRWKRIYEKNGERGFIEKKRNKSYTIEFKLEAIEAYLNGEGSLDDIADQYNIPSKTTLRKWIIDYNSHIDQKDYCPQGEVYMAKSRKTTLEERKEIVEYCLEHNREYKLAAKEYDVSYTQVYQWVRKYLKDGEDGLRDRRGKHKDDQELDELSRLQRKVARLEKELNMKEMENLLLKKVREVERRRYSPKANKK